MGGVGESPFPPPAPEWPGTLPEWAIYWAHTSLGLREGQDFAYLARDPQSGIQVDFTEFTAAIAIQVQGLFWHYQFRERPRFRDLAQRSELTSLGYTVVWIDEDAAIRSPVYYLQAALRGRDLSIGGGGF